MPFLYVYSPSDFVGGLPDEAGAAAAGTAPFTLQLVPGATGTRIEVSDDDIIFDEVDGSQVLDAAVTLDGTPYAAGTSINTAYDLINTGTGHKVTSFHFGGDGYQQGAVDGIASTVPLVAGSSYTFNTERTSHTQPNAYDDYVACFAEGTKIQTSFGSFAIEDIRAGDSVVTLENGLQDVLWVGKSTVRGHGKLAPVCFAPEAVGNSEELLLSPNHRVQIGNPIVQLYFGSEAALVAAKSLVNGTTITRRMVDEITYYHILTAQHDIVFANGAPAETLFLGSSSQPALSDEAIEEISTLFPELFEEQVDKSAAFPCLRAYEAKLLQAL
ncbi:Hint domain-containing protein [Planktotalea sp.]|uniref:Hint domain-containing protein n=1 Tax=Planktotalea sp. TaxID=2029877 RepID=UPI003D6C33D9